MTEKLKEKPKESRGTWHFERIGRPDVWYDSRTTFESHNSEYDRLISERKKLGPTTQTIEVNGVVIEE